MTPVTPPTLTVAIPVFNEADIIFDTLSELKRTLGDAGEIGSFEILVVDDGSLDDTAGVVEQFEDYQGVVRLVRHLSNRGRGAAVRTAMENFQGEVLVVVDSDLSYSAGTVIDLALPILSGDADLTLASPYAPGGRVENVPLLRAIISRMGNFVLRDTFRVRRPTSTAIVRGYSRDLVESLSLLGFGKELNLEVLYKAELLGYRIADVPAVLAWPEERKDREKRRGVKGLFSLGPAIRSHLLFQIVARPSVLFGLPIFVSTLAFLYGLFSLLSSMFNRATAGQPNPVRETLLEGSLTLTVTGFSFIVGLLFTVIFFLVVQGKLYFEETFVFLTKVLRDVKKR